MKPNKIIKLTVCGDRRYLLLKIVQIQLGTVKSPTLGISDIPVLVRALRLEWQDGPQAVDGDFMQAMVGGTAR